MNEENNQKVKSIVLDDFYEFQSKIRRLIKDMVKDPNMRVVLSAKRNLSRSALRQIDYVMEITDEKNVHFFNLEDLVKGGFAVPATPDYPEVEAEEDTTNIFEEAEPLPKIPKKI